MNHHLVSSSERPEQLQNRDVEGYAGHGQPDAGLDTDDLIHAGEKINDIAVLDHYSFWLACRTRSVDDVCQIVPGCGRWHAVWALRGDPFGVAVQRNNARGAGRQGCAE